MERTGDCRWRVEVELEAGVHRYKFCLDGERWVPDPASEENEDDGFGSENSVLRLGALGRPETMERVLADGAVNTAALAHDPALPLYRHRLADGRVRLGTGPSMVTSAVMLLREGAPPLELAPIESPSPFTFWQVDLDVPAGSEPLAYSFALRDGGSARLDPGPRPRSRGAPRDPHPGLGQGGDLVPDLPRALPQRRNGQRPRLTRPVDVGLERAGRVRGRGRPDLLGVLRLPAHLRRGPEGPGGSLDHLQELGVTRSTSTRSSRPSPTSTTRPTSATWTRRSAPARTGPQWRGRGPARPVHLDVDPLRPCLPRLPRGVHARLKVILDGVFNHVGPAIPPSGRAGARPGVGLRRLVRRGLLGPVRAPGLGRLRRPARLRQGQRRARVGGRQGAHLRGHSALDGPRRRRRSRGRDRRLAPRRPHGDAHAVLGRVARARQVDQPRRLHLRGGLGPRGPSGSTGAPSTR